MRLDDPNANDPRATLLNQPTQVTPGTVALLITEVTRTPVFWFSLLGMMAQLPNGLAELRAYQGSDVAALRNQACADMDGDWIWFIDDDHGFPPDILFQLLRRNVDVVQPLCLRRVQPFLPVATELDGGFFRIADHDPDELVEVEAAGSSGMLIRRPVIDALADPWFELGNGVSEDVSFCRKTRAAGFRIHVDTAVRLGHATSALVWPEWEEDEQRWMTGFTIADGASLKIFPADPQQMEDAALEATQE